MLSKAETVIIGGGCVGTSIAHHLTKMGSSGVVLLEKGYLAWGATGKSSAIVNMGVWNVSKPLAKMLVESLGIFHNFADAVGGDSGFTQTGWMGLAGPAQVARIEEAVHLQNETGAHSQLLSSQELKELEPRIFADDVRIGIYEPTSGYADPVKTTNAFARQAEKNGAQILTGVQVNRIMTENGQVSGVETNQGTVKASKVVCAANVWARELLAKLNVNIPIEPTRKQVCLFKRPTDFGKAHMITDDFVADIYMKPEGEQTLVGEIESPGSPMNPDSYNEGIDSDTVLKYSQKVVHRFPALGAAISRGGYSGPYDVSPDGHPILDEIPGIKGLYCAVGMSGHGFRFSPVTGRLVSEFILRGKTTGVDIREFRLSRFAEGKPIISTIRQGSR
ncbi:MAG: FAD-binding oxidoreductase [Candidatus Bathyarchaeia archaeon]|jgi:glycine/D-amino acid oxidase-like deaminating enzyme